jgi:hypothetical protein
MGAHRWPNPNDNNEIDMIEELIRIDKIARYYFLAVSMIFLWVAVTSFTSASLTAGWFGMICLCLSFIQFSIGIGLLQRRRWALKISRYYVKIFHPEFFLFQAIPLLTEWLVHIKDPQLDQYFK